MTEQSAIPPNIMAADNQLTTAGFMLSMLTEPRPNAERIHLLETALDCIRSAEELLRV